MLLKEDIKFQEPEPGDRVLFFRHNPRTGHRQTDIGIIVRELDETSWIVSDDIRLKEQILFVLTYKGYEKQQLLISSPTVTKSVRQILEDGKAQT